MKNRHLSALLLFALAAAASLPAAAAPDNGKTIVITASDMLKFSVTQIEVQRGQTIHIQLKNVGTMPKDIMGHNWILLKAGSDATAYATAALSAKGEGYQPKSLADQVLASIPLLGPKQTGEVTFVAPDTPGSYPYLCTFPGHFQAGMRGELIVK
jgi:azurin